MKVYFCAVRYCFFFAKLSAITFYDLIYDKILVFKQE